MTVISREPNQKFISTSYVERQNLNIDMHKRRFTHLITPSAKIENILSNGITFYVQPVKCGVYYRTMQAALIKSLIHPYK